MAIKGINMFENGEIKNQKLEEEEPVPFTNGIPQVFKDYCQAALTMTTTESSDYFMVHQNDARGYIICADTMMVILLPTSNAW